MKSDNSQSFEFAEDAVSAELQNEPSQEEANPDHLIKTSCFTEDIYQALPDILAKACAAFEDNRERDVILTGALTIISGSLPNVSGVYADQVVYPNLYCFVVAPAASGKGVLKFAKMLADKVHDKQLSESKIAEKNYQTKLFEFRSRHRSKRKNESIDGCPVQPPMKVLFIPANSSYAKILWHLAQNDGVGIICETEADTMVIAFKQDWGSYSDLLRKAFHHERISSSKKTNNEYLEIINPRLSVALSGTPSQVMGLISSSEDGLFSRFMFYSFRVEPVWRSVSPKNEGGNLNEYFLRLSEKVASLFDYLTEYKTIVELSSEQWDRLDAICTEWLHQVTVFNGNESGSIVKRVGLVMYRIAMILTAIRKFENTDESTVVKCSDQDFETSLQLTKIYLEHNVFMFSNLPKQDGANLFRGTSNKQKFYDELPMQFKRTDAVELGKKHGMSVRTVDSLLKKLLGSYLKQEAFGTYSKIILNSKSN